jgi:TatD DNase family protein
MYFDTHAHYNDKKYNDDRHELLSALNSVGVTRVLNVSYDLPSARFGLDLADKYPFVYASVGIHPHDVKTMTVASDAAGGTIAELSKLLEHPKAVAVGEIGLDYHHDLSPRDIQKRRFREQLELARRINKPVIIHMREATQGTLEIMDDFRDLSAVFHCFPGNAETAKVILDCGWYISFTGVVTFKNAHRAIEALRYIPLDRLMLETDCPYMAPEPYRGKRNSSLYLPQIAEKIAEARGIAVDEIATATMENALRFFRIGQQRVF